MEPVNKTENSADPLFSKENICWQIYHSHYSPVFLVMKETDRRKSVWYIEILMLFKVKAAFFGHTLFHIQELVIFVNADFLERPS
jgi:hypothetical protein